MTVIVAQIRSAINIPSSDDLADTVILDAIERAHNYISDIARRTSASPHIIDTVELNYAAYLAYQSYADRVLQQLPGVFDSNGQFNPVAAVLLRSTKDKLDGLKRISDESITYMQYNFPKTESSPVIEMADAADYPDEYRMTTLRSRW